LAGVSLRRGQAIVTLEFGSASLISEVSQSFAAQPTHEIHELCRRSRCTQWDNRHGGRDSLGPVNWPSFCNRPTPTSGQPDHTAQQSTSWSALREVLVQALGQETSPSRTSQVSVSRLTLPLKKPFRSPPMRKTPRTSTAFACPHECRTKHSCRDCGRRSPSPG